MDDEQLAQLETRLDDALSDLQREVAMLAVLLPDLPARHKRLIDNVLEAVRAWEVDQP